MPNEKILVLGASGVEAVEFNAPYFSKDGTMWVGLFRAGYRVAYVGEVWEVVVEVWGQEDESLGTFGCREEAEQFARVTYALEKANE